MDFLLRYGVALWIMIAVVCTVLGLILTVARRAKPEQSSGVTRLTPTEPVLTSRSSPISSRTCPACGQPGDPQARFCGACGSSLALFPAKARKQVGATTVLVDERALEQELSQERRARWR